MAFRIPYRYYKYLVIPFKLTNILAIFQAAIDYIIQYCLDKFIVYYLDNILIYSKILEEYKKYI
jgi:hypothetical protein